MDGMDADSIKPKRKRRWFRFSLQSLFIVVSVVAGFLGGRASNQAEVDRQQAEVDRLQEEVNSLEWELQVPILIENLKANQTFANRFAVNQCKKLGPAAANALPALKELRARTTDSDFLSRIDEAIAAVEGA